MINLVMVLLLLVAVAPVHAQSGGESEANTSSAAEQSGEAASAMTDTVGMLDVSEPYSLGIGVKVGLFGGGVATENAEGRKVNPDFWWVPTYGAVIYAPFGTGSKLGGRLDIGVNTTGTRTRPYEYYYGETNWEGYFIERYTYFCVAPQVSLAGVLIGVGFNFPMSAQRWHPDMPDNKYTVDNEILSSPAVDFRLGGMINVWETKVGKLMVELQGSIFFSGLFKEDQYVYGHTTNPQGVRPPSFATDEAIDLVPASAHIGISYLFSLGL